MPMKEALISIGPAIPLRDLALAVGGSVKFRCPECKHAVSPHRKGEGPDGDDAPHFEHLPGHPKTCSLSRKGKKQRT
jgi:hypothetical protein